MRLFFRLILFLLLTISLASCASQTGGGGATTGGAKKKGGKIYKVGVLLPLSGQFSLYGNSTLQGIQCAVGLTPPCTSAMNIDLIVKDTGSSTVKTEAAIEELAGEKVIAIIGPLLSSTVDAAARKAQELRIPMISLSQKENVSEAGDYIFKHSLTSLDQVETLANFAVEKKKLKNFGIIYPSNKYGYEFARLFREAVEAKGGKVVYERGYLHSDLKGPEQPKKKENISGYTTGLSGAAEEEKGATEEKEEIRFIVPSSVQAIFIPDSYKAVKYVVRAMHEGTPDVGNIMLLGVNRWNNPGLVEDGMGSLEGAVFVDGFYKEGSDPTTRNFVQSFSHAYNVEPTILEAQAFDALKLIEAAIKGGGNTRDKLKSKLATLKNVDGATGKIRFGENRETRRNLFILTVQHGAIAELSSAAKIPAKSNTTYSSVVKPSTKSEALSNAKYDGRQAPDLSIRTDIDKYDSPEF